MRSIALLRKAGVSLLKDGKELTERNISWRDRLATNGIFPEEVDLMRLQEVESWVARKNLVQDKLLDTKGWRWDGDDGEVNWGAATKEWTLKLADRKDFTDYFNGKWNRNDGQETWRQRWMRLWAAPITFRRKAWLWRFMQRGYFLNSRGSGRIEEEKRCQICNYDEETLEHTFWTCSRLRRRRASLMECGVLDPGLDSLIQWLDCALKDASTNTSLLTLLEEIRRELDAYPTVSSSERTRTITKAALEMVKGWTHTWSQQRQNGAAREEERPPYLQSADPHAESPTTLQATTEDDDSLTSDDSSEESEEVSLF
ncbi:hypothetical protein R1sor_015597 [Riccia sorocarpa]|uniref:Reverse transcriptase zinc-binding domain-containing protein n=1 Tax=Riccia sorocarpa TaxID=122646 RepID=A0ABD3HD30_9MARC